MKPIEYPPPPEKLSDQRWWKAIGFLGPGIIIASVSIGNGETVFASRGGAIFGYSILWCFFLGIFLKGAQIYASARYMLLSGEHPMQSWTMIPGPRGWFPLGLLFITAICLPFLLASLSLSVGSLIAWIMNADGDPDFIVRSWSTLLILVAVAFSWRQGYKRLERTQTLVVALLLVSILVAAIACQPSILGLVKGLFVPTIPNYKDWIHENYPNIASTSAWIEIVSYIGIIGGGLPAYIGYFSFLREKRWGIFQRESIYRHSTTEGYTEIDTSDSNLSNGRTWLRAVKIDVAGSFITVFIFSAAFMVLGSAILHEGHQIPDGLDLLSHQESFLTNIHPTLLILYRIGIFTAIGGTLFATFDVWTKSVYEGLIPFKKEGQAIDSDRLKRIIIVTTSTVGIAVIWIGRQWAPLENPISLVRIPAMLGGTLGCGAWCLGVAWADRRNLPNQLKMKAPLFWGLLLSGTVLLAFGVIGMYMRFFG